MTEQLASPSGLTISYREWGRADGPVAIAQPRPDGLLKPVVGFRG